MKNCPKCGGSGKVQDDRVLGASLRKKREAKQVTLRDCAGQMGLSTGYICDLEHGRRIWSDDLRQRYLKAIGG